MLALCDNVIFYKKEDEQLNCGPTAGDKETSNPHPHTENYNSLNKK